MTNFMRTIGKIAAHSAYEMFSWYKYLIVSLVFSHLGFWSGNLFLIAPFPDLCLLVPLKETICCQAIEGNPWKPKEKQHLNPDGSKA